MTVLKLLVPMMAFALCNALVTIILVEDGSDVVITAKGSIDLSLFSAPMASGGTVSPFFNAMASV